LQAFRTTFIQNYTKDPFGYVASLAFLLGGEINAEIEHAAAQRSHPEAKAEGEKKSA
jgi:hypothetical protein